MHWSAKYVGLEFSENLRCYDLVRSVLKNERNIDLPDYADISAEDAIRISQSLDEPSTDQLPWNKVDLANIREFDVVVMLRRRSREPGHVGIMVDSKHVLHIEKVTQSVIIPITHFSVKSRIIGFRRHKCL